MAVSHGLVSGCVGHDETGVNEAKGGHPEYVDDGENRGDEEESSVSFQNETFFRRHHRCFFSGSVRSPEAVVEVEPGNDESEMEGDGEDDEEEEEVEVEVVVLTDDVGDVRAKVVEPSDALAERRIVLRSRRLLYEAARTEVRTRKFAVSRQLDNSVDSVLSGWIDDARIDDDGENEIYREARHQKKVQESERCGHFCHRARRREAGDDESYRSTGEATHSVASRAPRCHRDENDLNDRQRDRARLPSVRLGDKYRRTKTDPR